MQTVEGGRATMKKREAQKLGLEDYLGFFDNRDLDLTSSQLRQIIGMHGFKKMKFQKNLSIEMISTMDLMDLRRSTLLDDGVSGDASFALDEVIKDLKDLGWQECNVTSLLTQGAVVPPPAAAVAEKRKRGGGETVPVKRKIGGEAVPVKRKSGGEAVPVKRKSGGEAVPVKRTGSGETVSVKRKSGGGTVSVKRKKLKSLKSIEQNAIKVGVGNSAFRAGTPVAAGSTPEVLRSSNAVFAAGTPFPARGTTDILRSLASNSLAAVASPPIISLLTGRQLRRLLKSNKCFLAQSV